PLERARHLERAAAHDSSDRELHREAAAALVEAAAGLVDGARVAEGVRLLQRATELGYRQPPGLVHLARRLVDAARSDDAMAALALLPAELDDPALEAERVHIEGVALLNRDPGLAVRKF